MKQICDLNLSEEYMKGAAALVKEEDVYNFEKQLINMISNVLIS